MIGPLVERERMIDDGRGDPPALGSEPARRRQRVEVQVGDGRADLGERDRRRDGRGPGYAPELIITCLMNV